MNIKKNLNSKPKIFLFVIGVIFLIIVIAFIIGIIYMDNYKNPSDKKLLEAGIVEKLHK